MYNVENVLPFWRMRLASRDETRIYIQSRNKMVALGCVYTLGNKLRVPSNAVRVGMPSTLTS